MTTAIREAIRAEALARGFDAVGFAEARLAGLVEHVDWDTAARIPIAADAQPFRHRRRDQPAGDGQRAILVERAVITERSKK